MNQAKVLSECCKVPLQMIDVYHEGNRLVGIYICQECKRDYKI